MNMGGNIDPDLNEKDVGREQDVANPKSVDKDVKILNNVSSNSNIRLGISPNTQPSLNWGFVVDCVNIRIDIGYLLSKVCTLLVLDLKVCKFTRLVGRSLKKFKIRSTTTSNLDYYF